MANVVLTVGGYFKFLIDEKDAGAVALALAKAVSIDRETKYCKSAEGSIGEWHYTRSHSIELQSAPKAKFWATEAEAREEVQRRCDAAEAAEQARLDAQAADAVPAEEVFA